MARFKPGQEVVCVMRVWYAQGIPPGIFGPKRDEIVTVSGYVTETMLTLVGYEVCTCGTLAAFNEIGFEPVVPQEEIEKLLEEIQITA